ncbi:MAG: Lrp/AsnC family transcriptional regulator [Candidatus Bathyarchaeota archaeon]|jgi:DNA-binding Lrp family transcriptional regulator
MKETMKKLLLELMKDSSRSDRKLAKVLGVSQATVSRMRSKLVSERIIREFTVIPDFVKMGYEIMAISFVKTKMAAEMRERAEKYVDEHANIIFMTGAQGMGRNGLMISLHKDYAGYSDFLSDLLMYWGDDVEERDDILISLKQPPVRPFSLSYLAKLEEKPEG